MTSSGLTTGITSSFTIEEFYRGRYNAVYS
jgi:hypothetical protein